jgi:hypothetical protein
MSTLIGRVVRAVFIVGVVAALALGVHAAFAAGRALQCPCDPDDPGAREFCIRCCGGTPASLCPPGAGGERECLCAG